MKILITTDSYLPRLGGAEIHALKLGLFMKRAGHEVRLFTSEKMQGEGKLSNFPVVRKKYSRRPKDILDFYWTLWREIRNADLVYSVYCHKIAAAVGIIKFFAKRPLVISLQGRGILDIPGNSWLYAKLHRFYRSVSLKRADKILASCLEFVDIAKKYTSAEKILYMPNAIDIGEFKLRPKNFNLYPFPVNNKKIVATIRRLVPKNGVQFLIEAIPYMVKDFKDVIFYIIGWGRLEDYLKNRVKQLNISEYVYFAGRVENDALPEYLNLADLVIFPSTAEATSIACLESMALGKPILASNVGGYPEMVIDGYNGFLVNLTDKIESDYNAPMTLPEDKLRDFADKIVRMLKDENLLKRFGENSRYLAETKFNWHSRINELISIFNNLINKSEADIKKFYSSFGDKILDKRFQSKYKLRQYAHTMQYQSVLSFVRPGIKVLDAGCGEGVLSVMMAKKKAAITACDLSELNIERAKKYAEEEVADKINFLIADLESLPFADNSFDLVVSSHVLEHLPDFGRGLSELMRVTKKRSIVAIPTILNPCSLIQVGGGDFWMRRKKSFLAIVLGPLKMLWALLTFREGVDETYSGSGMPHVFRFPWTMKRKIKKLGFRLVDYEASSICLPLFESFLPLIRFLDKYKNRPILRNFGYGTTYVVEKL